MIRGISAPGIIRPRKRQFLGPVAVDWRLPVAQGVIACYQPSPWNGFRNLAGQGADLTPKSAAGFSVSAAGHSVPGLVASQGADCVIGATHPLCLTGSISIFWYGTIIGDASASNATLFGVEADNTDTAPFTSYSLDRVGGVPAGILFEYNVAGVAASLRFSTALNTAALYGGVPTGFLLTATAGGVVTLYADGVPQTAGTQTGSVYNGTQTFTSTAVVNLGAYTPVAARFINGHSALGVIWKRALTAGEAKLLANEPYILLAPLARRRRGPMAFAQSAQATATPLGSTQKTIGKVLVGDGNNPFSSDFSADFGGGAGSGTGASTAPVASAAAVKSRSAAAQASTTPVAALVRAIGKVAKSSVTPPATGSRAVVKAASATTSPASSVVRAVGKSLLGATSPSAASVKSVGKGAQASITPLARVGRAISRGTAQATSSPVAAAIATRVKLVTGSASTSPVSALVRQVGKRIAAAASPAGSIVKLSSKGAQAATTPQATAARAALRHVTAQALGNAAGQLTRMSTRLAAATTAPASTSRNTPGKTAVATSAPVGSVRKSATRTSSAASIPAASASRGLLAARVGQAATAPTTSLRRGFAILRQASSAPAASLLRFFGLVVRAIVAPIAAAAAIKNQTAALPNPHYTLGRFKARAVAVVGLGRVRLLGAVRKRIRSL